MAPKISIIVPAYNEEKYIARCLDSILNQTFTDFEVICVDDGSTDNTFNILTEYSEKDSRIIPLKNTGKGVSSARNYGIENSNGEYIGFVDSDDFIQPQMYEFLYKAVYDNKTDISVCNFISVNNQNNTNKFFSYVCFQCDSNYFIKNNYQSLYICVWNKLINKKILNGINFKKLKIGEDLVFSSEIYKKSNNIIFVDLPLYNYYINPQGTTKKNNSDIKWLDRPKSHYLSYKILENYADSYVSSWILEQGIKHLLTYKFFAPKNYYSEIKKVYKEMSPDFYNNKNILFLNKIYVFISYNFTLLYKLRRKLLDKTLR